MKKAFSIIELIVVIVIIAVLAGLVMAVSGKIRTQSMIAATKSEVALLGMAIREYKRDNGSWPVQGNSSLVNALEDVYYQFKAKRVVGNEYMDPWGNAYQYYTVSVPPPFPSQWNLKNENAFDLFSYGPDGDKNTDDDVINW